MAVMKSVRSTPFALRFKRKPPSPGWVGNGGVNGVSSSLVLVTGLAAGFAVFRAAGRLGLGVTGGAFLLRRAGREEERGSSHENGGETNHFRRWLRSSKHCVKQRSDYLLQLAGGGGGGGAFCWQALRRAEAATRVRIAIFMCICVGVNRVVMVPIHQTPGSGIGETNDKFHLCK